MPILLIVVGITLIYINFKAIKKNENSFRNMLEYKKEDISDIELQIGALRMDIANSLTDLQKEIIDIKASLPNSEVVVEIEDVSIDAKTSVTETVLVEKEEENSEIKFLLNEEDGVINQISKKGKTELIKELIEQGLKDDEICNKLSLGKGEVILVRGLYKK